jgi:peptide/nickel transport system substrate-binding protein
MRLQRPLAAVFACALWVIAAPAVSKTVRVASQGDALSMDPHSLAEAVQLSLLGNVYEPLVTRDKTLKLAPALATRWELRAPTVWRFELRRNVRFHDGSPFDADDVMFSLQRARGEGSDMRTQTASIKEVRRIDDFTVDIETSSPNPILPELLTTVYLMDRQWAEKLRAERPVDRRRGVENQASFQANGTGPFRVRERQPNVRTLLQRHAGWWGAREGNVEEVVFMPIGNDATRVAALASGEVDVIDPVPLQDVARLQASPALKVMQGPESRIVFLGFDQKRDELLYASVKGANPFKDKRVRQAFAQAIDIGEIVRTVMRGAATPAALMVASGIRGWRKELDVRSPYDPESAKQLLAQAGYGAGFAVTLNCPNDRYVNDAEICQAVAAYLARVGVRVTVQAESKTTYFPRVLRRDTSFFMAGWSPAGYDAHNALFSLMATPEGGRGAWNLGAYSQPRIDELTTAIQSETDGAKRDAMIGEALRIHRDDFGHLPLHQQSLTWGMKKTLDAYQRADNFMFFKWMTLR